MSLAEESDPEARIQLSEKLNRIHKQTNQIQDLVDAYRALKTDPEYQLMHDGSGKAACPPPAV